MKVSVLITAFNHEKYIARALAGVLAQQTSFDYEVIVGDDASTDRTREIILEYARNNPGRIRTVFPDSNLGLNGKRLFAEIMRTSCGEYLAMQDGDDYWTSPVKLQRQADFLDAHPECSMCFHNVLKVYEDGSQPSSPYNQATQPVRTSLDDVLRSCYVAACSPVFRRDVLDPLPEWYYKFWIGDWTRYIMAAQSGEIAYIDEIMGVYRLHNKGLWSEKGRREHLELLIGIYEGFRDLPNLGNNPIIDSTLANRYYSLAMECEVTGEISKAKECLSKSFRLKPFRWGTLDTGLLLLWLKLYAPPLRKLGLHLRKMRHV